MTEYEAIEKEFEENEVNYMFVAYRNGEPIIWRRENTDAMSFNVWSFLTKGTPKFDEIRIRAMTDEESERWNNGEWIATNGEWIDD